jgi:hypothetical protein
MIASHTATVTVIVFKLVLLYKNKMEYVDLYLILNGRSSGKNMIKICAGE